MMNVKLAILISGLLLTGCQKAEIKDTKSELIGTWEWALTSGGLFLTVKTPATEGYRQQLEFTRNRVTQYKNGTVESKSRYYLKTGESIRTVDETLIIQFGTNGRTQSLEMEADTLYLYEECHDCFSHKYVRIQ